MKLIYAVIGTGGIWGYYVGKLANNNHDVHFLFHSDYNHVNQHGLRVDSVYGASIFYIQMHLPIRLQCQKLM